MILILDNYDSFTFNLVQYFGELLAGREEILVVRNDAHSVDEILAMGPTHLVVSPGPCSPSEAGISVELIARCPASIPLLGVCLGHQALGQAMGGIVERAVAPMHGKVSEIRHDGTGIFRNLPDPFEATRYHSLVVRKEGLPKCLRTTAWTVDGLIMGLEHVERPLYGVQFHPESIRTSHGKQILANFLAIEGSPMNVQQALAKVIDHHDLTQDEATQVAGSIMRGEATQAQIGGFLVALRMKGETVDEIAGFVSAMRENAVPCPVTVPVVDIVGTGGDHSGTFNISTTTAFVVAGAGGRVAKHGNRGVSSKSGAADVLATLGLNLELSPEEVAACVHRAGVGFLFAQAFHPAMRHVGPVRREMGVRTVFNLLGPLTNPAGTKRLVVGVFDRKWCRPLAEALSRLGTEVAWVVNGSDGLDEITTTGSTHVAAWDGTAVTEFDISPADAGLELARTADLKGGDPVENAQITREILSGAKGPKRDIVVINAAAALVVCGLAQNLSEGARMAEAGIDSGKAIAALDTLVATSRELRP